MAGRTLGELRGPASSNSLETQLLVGETPPRQRSAKYHHPADADKETVSNGIATCMAINFIMGSGFLGLPYAFNSTGEVLAVLGMLLVTASTFISVDLLIDVMKRAEALTLRMYEPAKHLMKPDLEVSQRKFEIVELVELFMGTWAKRGYGVVVCVYLMGVQWGYVVVFANAFASHVPVHFLNGGNTCNVYDDPNCESVYKFWALLFVVVFTIASCFNLREQASVQACMTVLRILMITLMTITVMVAMFSGSNMFDTSIPKDDFKMNRLFDFGGFPPYFPIAVYSQQLITGVPVLVQTAREKTKVLWGVFGSTFAFTFISYTISSIFISLYFGSTVLPSCNVNWATFTGGYSVENRPGWATFISFLVVLFPAIDVLSISPINSIILASNVMSAVYGERTPKKEKNRALVIAWRLGTAVPPSLLGVFFYKLNNVLDASGVVSMIIGMIFPPLLWILSSRRIDEGWPALAGKAKKKFLGITQMMFCKGLLVFGVTTFLLSSVEEFLNPNG